MKCRVCASPIHAFMSFGKMPIANAFLTEDQIKDEYFYELAPAVCGKCGMFQLMEQPDPKRMFHNDYAFYSGTSKAMDRHFADWAAQLPIRSHHHVIEIGCNDGTFLKHLAARGAYCTGIEPAANVAKIAQQYAPVVNGFFNKATIAGLDKADFILAANVVCHIPDINALAENVASLLEPFGFFMFEEPYLPDMLQKTAFDQIYDEHVFMLSALSVERAFKPHGLHLINCQRQPTHGGSMRYTVCRHEGWKRPSVNVAIEREILLGLHGRLAYKAFAIRCELRRDDLSNTIYILKSPKRIVGYGATSKSTTVLNYCQLGPADIEYISDTTPIKQGKLSPGMHIPIRSHDEFAANPPDYALLFAWNHAEEIMSKEKFRGQWINYIPMVTVH